MSMLYSLSLAQLLCKLQDAVTLWDNEAVDGKEKIRHVFLFPDQMVMTKPSKSANIEEYEYKNTCQVCIPILASRSEGVVKLVWSCVMS